jgi:hypothetical protein
MSPYMDHHGSIAIKNMYTKICLNEEKCSCPVLDIFMSHTFHPSYYIPKLYYRHYKILDHTRLSGSLSSIRFNVNKGYGLFSSFQTREAFWTRF